MRQAVFDLACRHARDGATIVDLGCSRGEALAPLIDRFGARCRFVGVEVSPPMLEAARARFEGLSRVGIVQIRDLDLRRDYPEEPASVVTSVFTLQFVPIEFRLGIIKKIWRHLTPGGAFIWCEKVMSATADLQAEFVATYHAMKEQNGYTSDEIERKRMSLEGVLVPVPARWNEEMLKSAGFTDVDCFWRWMNFAGWIAVR
jgi:tRNA (cmo5U34)-methyltransferase